MRKKAAEGGGRHRLSCGDRRPRRSIFPEGVFFLEENKMGVMPVRRLLIHMAWPMMLSMFIQALYNMVDSMFVSWMSGEAFQALSLAYPVQMFMISVCVGTGVGVNALLSRRLGEQDPEGANAVAMNGYFVYLLSWLAFLLFGLLLARPFMGFFTSDAAIAGYGGVYLSIVTCGSIGVTMQFASERVLLASGDPVGPMVIQGVGAVINLILDPLMIFGIGPFPALGVAGAAIATVFGQLVGTLVGFVLVRRCPALKLHIRGFRPSPAVIGEVYRIGLPAIVMQSLASFMTLGLNKIMALYSAHAVYVLGAYFKLQSFIFMPVYGLNNGLIPVVGYNYGARSRNRITGLTRFALQIGGAIMALGTALFLLFPGVFLALFKADAAQLAAGIPALRMIAAGFLFAGVSIILCAVLQAMGSAMESLIISLLRQILLILPAAWLLGRFSPAVMWLCFPIAEILSCAVALVFYRQVYRGKLSRL